MTLKFVIILQNLIKAYHRKSVKSKYDRKLTELDVEITRTCRDHTDPRVNGGLNCSSSFAILVKTNYSQLSLRKILGIYR